MHCDAKRVRDGSRQMREWRFRKVCKFYQVLFFVGDSIGDLTFGFLFKFEIDTFDYEWMGKICRVKT